MNREAYSKAELDAMHVEEVTSEVIQVLRIADSLEGVTFKGLSKAMDWNTARWDIWSKLKELRFIETSDEVIKQNTKWSFSPLALDYCRIFKKQTERNWYRNCQDNFADHVNTVVYRIAKNMLDARALQINGRRHWFVNLPYGPESLLIAFDDEKHTKRSAIKVSKPPARKKKAEAPVQYSDSEILMQGKPSDVIRMLKPIDTARALWVRAKCKMYERERRLPESIIQEAREILGIYAPSCAPRFGCSL